MNLIERSKLRDRLVSEIDAYPITLLLGPRQCGKTTLARQIADRFEATYFDLEDPETPLHPQQAKLVLQNLTGLVVIDECQRQPDLFPLLRVLADRRPLPAHFLILGSASPGLLRNASESMAGRVSYVPMSGFSLEETKETASGNLWVRGAFPDAYLANTDDISFRWRLNFIQSFLERDMPALGIRIPPIALRRFWTMLAHVHGQVWNASELARAMDVKQDTARHYLDILSGAYMVRQLPPWFENTGKRLVKSPKIYLRDSGLLHALLGLHTRNQVLSHPKLGFSWEGFALEETLRHLEAEYDAYFYKTHGGAELDLFLIRGGKRYGFEFKFSDHPRTTKAMHIAIDDLNLEQLFIIHPGTQRVPLTNRIETLPLSQISNLQFSLHE